jgi:ABC-2 type transport system permease protein
MSTASTASTGAIYDIGYRSYEGVRMGRGYAFRTLLVHSFRTVWGLGRPGRARVIPFVLLGLVTFPALIQVLVTAVSQGEGKLISYESYFGGVHALVALFCAAQAPELVSTDQHNRVLPLYFSRPLRRGDYAAAKLAAMFLAVMLLILIPMAIIFLGRLSVASDMAGALRTEVPLLPSVLATSALVAALMASLSIALSSLSPRRAIASATVLGLILLAAALSAILQQTSKGALQQYAMLMNPVQTTSGVIAWVFHVPPPPKLPPGAPLPLPGPVMLAAVLGWIAASVATLFTRYARIPV